MSEDDRRRWDQRHAGRRHEAVEIGPPSAFSSVEHIFPAAGLALDIACGRGSASVWLARRGMAVLAVDVSPVAIDQAREVAERNGVLDRCRFLVHDLDQGLPRGPPVDLLLCHLFRDRRLDQAMMERVTPGGLLALAVLSEVGAEPGRFRAEPGELRATFQELDVVAEGEGEGVAWFIGRST